MDFSLLTKRTDFSLSSYLPKLEKTLHSYGFEISIQEKIKQHSTNVQSAFQKGNSLVHLIKIFALEAPVSGFPSNALIKIKFEIDIDPPKDAGFEKKYKLLPQPYSVTIYDRPSLFAGKLHALLCRNWKRREKGRDFYDYIWYLQEKVPVNLHHLEVRMRQSGHWRQSESMTLQSLKTMLIDRFENVDYDLIKQDVLPFIPNPKVIEIWSREFFIAVTNEMLPAV